MTNKSFFKKEKIVDSVWYLSIFAIYLLLRCFAWKNTVLFEDNDSLYLLYQIKTFLSFNIKNIIDMSPDSTPVYPFFGAICSLPGWSIEFGARLCSLLFSSLMFFAVVAIGKRLSDFSGIIIGLLIISFSYILIPLSYSVLTEPSYIAVCYVGLLLFLSQGSIPTMRSALMLGICFGFAFLSRTEGILYIAVIPFLQAGHYFIEKKKCYSFRKLCAWILIYVTAFCLIVAPQLWRVSSKMGILAINGRQVWTLILKNPDGKSVNEKINGLDYSPNEINLFYLQSHPDAVDHLVATASGKSFIRIAIRNFNELYQKNIGIMVGPVGFAFFILGLISLYAQGKRYECFVIVVFLGAAVIAPLVHDVEMRHIAIIAPLIMLIEGIGITYASAIILGQSNRSLVKRLCLNGVFTGAVVAACIFPLKAIYSYQENYNLEYSPTRIKALAKKLHAYIKNDNIINPVIITKKRHIAFYSDIDGLPLPYTDYPGLVTYCRLNKADYLFLENRLIDKYPFFSVFQGNKKHPEFTLLYSETDDFGQNVALYRINKRITEGKYDEK